MNNLPSLYQSKIYYVYTHIDPDTKELVYVGKGSRGRAWHCAESNSRGKDHALWMNSLILKGYTPDSWVKIVETSLTQTEATEKETFLIWNLEIFPKFNSKRDYCCILSKEDLDIIKTYRLNNISYEQIGKYLNCSTMTVYRAHTGETKNYI